MTDTADDLPAVHKRVAIKWLVWDRGMTVEDAAKCIEAWPDHGRASEAIDVATFIVERCRGS